MSRFDHRLSHNLEIVLDDLRLLVEKSELWVYKAVKPDDKKVSRLAIANVKTVKINPII